MPLIRALAYHADPRQPVNRIVKQLGEASTILDRIEENIDMDVWSTRLVFPRLTRLQGISQLSTYIEDALEEAGFSYAAMSLGPADHEKASDEIIESLRNTSTIFFSYKVADLNEDPCMINLRPVTAMLKKIASEAGPDACTRFAIAYGSPPETPYFPVCASRRQGISACLRYAGDLEDTDKNTIRHVIRRIVSNAYSILEEACQNLNLNYIGLDASLSPWMHESVAKIIEKLSGETFGEPGTLSAVHYLNKILSELSAELLLTGFNEIMLPLAEDSRLIELAEEHRIKASTLASLVSVSVAGLDMVAIPLNTDDITIENLVEDTLTLAYRKQKPTGIRLILVDLEPYEHVELERFPSIPVIPP